MGRAGNASSAARAALFAVIVGALAPACSTAMGRAERDAGAPDDPGPDPDATPGASLDAGIDAAPVAARPLCPVHLQVRPGGTALRVAVAGAWDWTQRAVLRDAGDGSYVLDRELAPGLYGYKVVVTRPGATTDEWLLDPGNPYRVYDGGVENSGLRVDDCNAPRLEATSHAITGARAGFEVKLTAGTAAVAADGVRVTLRDASSSIGAPAPVGTVHRDGDRISITLADLAVGKHTVIVDAVDGAGRSAHLLLPFWIEARPFDWRGALVYMIVTDRFRDGDRGNDPAPTSGADPGAEFRGGDLAGVTAAIDDGTFDSLGVDALWLTPFVANTRQAHDENGHGITAFHGYWPTHPRAIDPRLGDEAALTKLVASAHRHGLRVLMDFVINHVHEDHDYVAAHPTWFRRGCTCGTPGCDWTTHRLDCSFYPYLPDIDWTQPAAAEQVIPDALWWLERFDLDGLRVDAVKHVEDAAIIDLATRVRETFEQAGTRYFLLGETAMGWKGNRLEDNLGEYATIRRYLGHFGLDGQFDFVLFHATADRVWTDDLDGMLHLDYWTQESLRQYPADAIMTPFVGSHDSQRLITRATYTSSDPIVSHKFADQGLPAAPVDDAPYDRAALALTWMLTVPGAPLLYYGDEYGEFGGADPDNRHMWRAPAERDGRQRALYARVALAAQARHALPALRVGDYRALTVTETFLSFARTTPTAAAIVAINRDTHATTQTVTVPPILVGASLRDRLDPSRVVSLSGDRLTITLAARTAAILAP